MQQIKFPMSALTIQKNFDDALKVVSPHRVKLSMWDGENEAEIIVATCVYGFPSVVIVFQSIGSGITAEQWQPYGRLLSKPEIFIEMYLWIAQTLNTHATGRAFAAGTTSDFILL